MDELDQTGGGQPPVLDPPRPFRPLPLEVSDELAAYATVARQLPRDPLAPPKATHLSLGKIDCPFRPVEDVQRLFGAGTYLLTFFSDIHRHLGTAYVTVGDVPRPVPEHPETPANPASGTASAAGDAPPWAASLLARMDALERQAPAPRGMTMEDMRTVLELARGMAPPAQDATHVDSVARAFRQGMALAREVFDRSPAAGDNSIGGIIREALPGVLQMIQQAQGAAGAAPGPTLVATPAPAKGATVTPSWVMPMVQELNRAIAANDEPGYTADWLERNVPAEILTQLRGDENEVVQSLKGYGKAVPGLVTPEGEQFVRGVLRELRGELEGEDGAAAKTANE
jgi:hypothetical protein